MRKEKFPILERLELVDRLAALKTDLMPERGVPSEYLARLRLLLFREPREMRIAPGPAIPTRFTLLAAADRLGLSAIAPDLCGELERAVHIPPLPAELLEPGSDPLTNIRVTRRTLPFPCGLIPNCAAFGWRLIEQKTDA